LFLKEFDLEADPGSVYPASKIESLFETLRNGLCYEQSVFDCLEIISRFGIPAPSSESLRESAELLLINAFIRIRRMAAECFVDPQKLSSAPEEKLTEQNRFLTDVNSEQVVKGLTRLERAIIAGDTTNEKDALASALVNGIVVVDPNQESRNCLSLGQMTVFNSLVKDAVTCGSVGTKKKVELLLLYSCIACVNEESQKMLQELFNTTGLCSETPSEELLVCQPTYFNHICYCCTTPLFPGFIEETFRKVFANCNIISADLNNMQVLISMLGRSELPGQLKIRVVQRMYILCGSEEIRKEVIERTKGMSEALNDLAVWASENAANIGTEQFTMDRLLTWITSFSSSS